jgi:dolichol kinase
VEAHLAALSPSEAPPAKASPIQRPTNHARSLFHVASAATGFAAVALVPSRGVLLAIACAFATYAWSMEIVRRLSPAFNARIMRMYARVAHAHEWYRVNSATWYATALVLLAAFASRPGMIAGLAVLGVADPFAALIGRRYGRHKLRSGKSLEGALAFVASGTLAALGGLALLHAGSPESMIALAFASAVAGAIAEVWVSILDDNFTIPVVVGAVVTLATLG